MKTVKALQFLLFAAIIFALTACEKGIEGNDHKIPCDKVFIMYSCGHNNLSSSLLDDIKDVSKTSPFEAYSGKYRLIVFNHAINGNDFSRPVDPVLMEIRRNAKNEIERDTLLVLPSKTYAADGTPSEEGYTGSDAKTLRTILEYIKENIPAEQYGFLFSSHGTGWLPYDFYSTGKITKTVGADYSGKGWTKGVPCEMDVKEYAKAFLDAGMQMEFMLMDACFMGGVETAYELHSVCRYYVASQTEIWSDGLVYTSMLKNVFGKDTREGLKTLCSEYMAFYRRKASPATISMIEIPRLGMLSVCCADLFDKYRKNLDRINPSEVQVYLPTTSTPGWDSKTYFYDLEDIILHLGISEADKSTVLEHMKNAVVFKDATEYLFDGSKVRHIGGLSMYLPCAGSEELSNYYEDFRWNKVTALVK